MPIGAFYTNASFDGEQYPSLGGRRAAADSEQSCGSGHRGTEPWSAGRTTWSSGMAAQWRAKRTPIEKDEQPERQGVKMAYTHPQKPNYSAGSDRNAPTGAPDRGKSFKSSCVRRGQTRDQMWSSHGDQNARVCCLFLEGKCGKGDRCKYRHAQCDKFSTLCGYGIHCEFGHGAVILEATDTYGNNNPLLCCLFLETGRCINGPECKYRHERVADKWAVHCGFGNSCKYKHGAYADDGKYPRNAEQGSSSRGSLATAQFAKTTDALAKRCSRRVVHLTAAPEASPEYFDTYRSTEDHHDKDTSSEVLDFGFSGASEDSGPTTEPNAQISSKPSEPEAVKASTQPKVFNVTPDAWEDESMPSPAKASCGIAGQDCIQELLSARDTAAEDILGALEQAWEDVWSPTTRSVPDETSKDFVPDVMEMPQSTEQVGPGSGHLPVCEKPQTAVPSTAKAGVKQLPSWLVRPRRRVQREECGPTAIDAAKSDEKPVPSSGDINNPVATQDQKTAEHFPELGETHAERNETRVSVSDVDAEAVNTEPRCAAGEQSEAFDGCPIAKNLEADDDTLVQRCIRQKVACCHFLRGWCQFGDQCYYGHDWGLDPTCAECEYGENCVHGHGWYMYAMQRMSTKRFWKQSSLDNPAESAHHVADSEESSCGQAFSRDRVHDRACCRFLEYASCSAGLKCPFKHVLADPARTLCNYGRSECLHEHGWALHFETSQAKAMSPEQSAETALFQDGCTENLQLAAADKNDQEANEHGSVLMQVPPAISSGWEEEQSVLKMTTSINSMPDSKIKRGRACCRFLQHWHCRNGRLCEFQHVRCAPRLTLCHYGTQDCIYGHGWARQDANEDRQPFEQTPCTTTADLVGISDDNNLPLDETMTKGNETDNAQEIKKDYSDGIENRILHDVGKENHPRDRICCYYLQFWNCAQGKTCKYKHVKGDSATTVCGYGTNRCKFQHGWARGLQIKVAAETKSADDSEKRVCSRVCRNFLNGAIADRGSTGDWERKQDDRTAWLGGGDAAAGVRIPNAPTKLLRAALTGLLGWWNSTRADKTVQCHQVTMQLRPGGRGTAFLVCITTAKGQETSERIWVEGGDIVLGTKGEFFLDSSTNRYVTWLHKSKREVTRHWVRGWVGGTESTQQDDMDEVLLNEAFQFQ